jgi:glycosyltransferase involved in cell wall biosynthesis
MKFFLYSSTNAKTIASKLGGVDYSYYFVLKCYVPLLEQFGEVEVLDQPLTDASLDQLQLTGKDYYISFTPPNRVEMNSRIPVIPVFAWEFGTLPDAPFTAPSDDWNHVLTETGQALTHSEFAVSVVRKSLGEEYPVVSIPAPVWEKYADVRTMRKERVLPLHELSLDCTAIDSADYITLDGVDQVRDSIVVGRPHDRRDLVADDSDAWFGVHPLETWGRWTEQETCGLQLPYPVCGDVVVSFQVINSLLAPGQDITVALGDEQQSVGVEGGGQRVDLVFQDVDGAQQLQFRGLGPAVSASADDARVMGIGISGLYVRAPQGVLRPGDLCGHGNLLDKAEAYCIGFHELEPWGRWTGSERCYVFLPYYVEGDVTITLTVSANPHKQKSALKLSLGGKSVQVSLSGIGKTSRASFSQVNKTNLIAIDGIQAGVLTDSGDPRCLGLGISSIELNLENNGQRTSRSSSQIAADAVVFTTVFNPIDGRKNWPDILKAFVFALRDEPRAVLLAKITHSELSPFIKDLSSYFAGLGPFKCRIVFLHGFLEGEDFKKLISATHYAVNAAHGEGQCLPLMEFMSSGVPAIAPNHSAMADYINADNAFVIDSAIEPAVWPDDPRLLYKTTRYRIDWESMYKGFTEGFEVVVSGDERYQNMSTAAVASLKNYCSLEQAVPRMRDFLSAVGGDQAP